MADPHANLFCRADDLSNEASVESFFVLRLLHALGYEDAEVKTKHSLDALPVGKGRKKELYKPDFLIYCRRRPRWIVEAKATDENPDHYIYQGAGYSLGVNMKYQDENPVHYCVMTNGFLTRVYRWDQEQPVMSLRFADIAEGNTKYESLKELLGAKAARAGWQTKPKSTDATHLMTRPGMEEVKKTFHRCHRIIWKAEKVSPQAAFLRFAKVLFVKLWEDRKIRDDPDRLAAIGRGDPLSAETVRFSTRWIDQQEEFVENPVDTILFRQLVDAIEAEIQARKRKRIFEPDARLDISPGTVRRVVHELQHQYLFGIDEDLNGRMFEAFLVATMRGQELGQYFTPRSIVKLVTRLGKPVARPDKIDRVLDACCGTGGFLIEALTEMRRQIYENSSLTHHRRAELLYEVANDAIFGIDAGRDPPLVKIARINMYLHGDGGSRVYLTDGLKKTPEPSGTDDAEGRQEVQELRQILQGDRRNEPLRFDLVLTNPPFSMDYSMSVPQEAEVLGGYDLRKWEGISRGSLRSAVMFIERYYDLLEYGGRLLTVIDDSVLGGPRQGFVRDFIRQRFVINAIISLHGDAFRHAGARTKTSILSLTKRKKLEKDEETGEHEQPEEQPDIFVYESRYIGIDDVPTKTPPSVAEEARKNATNEIDEILSCYDQFSKGVKGPWLVKAERLSDRLDAKFLSPWSIEKLSGTWSRAGASTAVLGDLVDPVEETIQVWPDETYTFLRITYAGYATAGDRRLGKEISYDWVGRAQDEDIVVSHINAVHGATCVLPPKAVSFLITSEFTALRVRDLDVLDPMYLWSILRSPAVIAEWLSAATGLGRHRVDWSVLQQQKVPLLRIERQREIAEINRREYRLFEEMMALRKSAIQELGDLDLYGEMAMDKLVRAKPPR
jgi:type I restriction enzyme M protein